MRSTCWLIVAARSWCPAASVRSASCASTASGVFSPCARSPAFDTARATARSRCSSSALRSSTSGCTSLGYAPESWRSRAVSHLGQAAPDAIERHQRTADLRETSGHARHGDDGRHLDVRVDDRHRPHRGRAQGQQDRDDGEEAERPEHGPHHHAAPQRAQRHQPSASIRYPSPRTVSMKVPPSFRLRRAMKTSTVFESRSALCA